MSLKCYDCELEYNSDAWVETHIPDEIWKIISPNNDESGILCINCISRRLIQNNIIKCPMWLCGTSPLIAREGEPFIKVEKISTNIYCEDCSNLKLWLEGYAYYSECSECEDRSVCVVVKTNVIVNL